MLKHQQLTRKTSTPEVWKCEHEQSNRSVAHGQDRSLFHSTTRKGTQTVSVNGWLCHLGCSSADSLPSSKCLLSCRIEESDCKSMAETQSFIDKSVGEWRRRRLECASLLYGIISFARWRHFIFQSWFNLIMSQRSQWSNFDLCQIWCRSDNYF